MDLNASCQSPPPERIAAHKITPILTLYQQSFYYRGPGPGQVLAVITATSQRQQPSAAMAFSQQFQTLCSMSMRLCRIFQVSDWVAGQTVGATLQQDKLRFCPIKECFRRFPCLEKDLITGTGRHRNVQFGTGSRTATGFFHSTGPGIEVAAIFVEVHKHKIRVVLEGVEHAIAVMRIDVDRRRAEFRTAGAGSRWRSRNR